MEKGQDGLGKVERVMLRLALLILLAISLLKVIAPEIIELRETFDGRRGASATWSPARTDSPAAVTPVR